MKARVPAAKTPNLARLYARPGFLLRRAHQISSAVFEDACKGLALTPAQFGRHVFAVRHLNQIPQPGTASRHPTRL